MIPRPSPTLKPTFRCFTGIKRIDAEDGWEQLRARIEQTPSSAMVRGMFLSELLRSAPASGVQASRRYIPFSFYPVREYMELILRVAQTRRDKDSPATAVMRTGSGVYALFAASLAGTAIFSIARDFKRVVELSPKAYSVTLQSSAVEIVKAEPQAASVRLRGVWPYPDIFHVGIWLGAMEAFRVDGEIVVTRHSLSEVAFDLSWSGAPG
jgi:uncharacterized protein (TIGR02265 family)